MELFTEQKYNSAVPFLKLCYYSLLATASWYAYRHIADPKLKFEKEIFNLLITKFGNGNTIFSMVEILDTDFKDVIDWRGWIWALEEREDGKAYALPSEESILNYGIVIIYLLHPHMPLSQTNYYLSEIVKDVKRNPETISKMLCLSEENVTNGLIMLEKQIETLNAVNKRARSLKLAQAELSSDLIAIFNEKMTTQWRDSRNLYDVFQHYNAIEENPTIELLQIGTPRMYLNEGKVMFVDNGDNPSVFSVDWGKEVNRKIEETFVNTINNSKSLRIQQKSIIDAFENSIKSSGQAKESLVAFIPSHSSYKWLVELVNSGNFQTLNIDRKAYPFSLMGIYKDAIPVVRIHKRSLQNSLIVVKLPGGMRYQQRTNDKWEENQLQIKIERIDDNMARQKIAEKPEDYQNIDIETAVEILKADLIITVQEIMNFEILDPKAVIVYNIES